MTKRFLGLTLGLVLFGTPAAHADFQSLGVGMTVPTVMGAQYDTFEGSIGAQAEGEIGWDCLGKDANLHFSLGYTPYKVRNSTNVSMRQLDVFIGPQLISRGTKTFLKPFASLEGGLAYHFLSFSNSFNTTANGGISGAVRFRPGIDLGFSDGFSVLLGTPVSLFFTKTPVAIWAGTVSARFAL